MDTKDYLKVLGEDSCLAINDKENLTYLDTGSYIFNALLSASIFGGFASSRVTAVAGPPSTGKTWFAINMVKQFIEINENPTVIYFDSEAAVHKDMFIERGVDPTKVIISRVDTVEKFRCKALQILDGYLKKPEKDRNPLMFVLDSLGNLSTEKEMADALADKNTRDMTKAQLVRGTFRMLTAKLGKATVPLVVTNHTYESISMYSPGQEMGGGSGLKYASSLTIYLNKSKEKDGKEVVGTIIKAQAVKSRLSREFREVKIRLYYDERGLDRYYGLLELGELAGYWKRSMGRYDMGDGVKRTESQIMGEPEKYFTPEIMVKLDEAAKIEFAYGSAGFGKIIERDDEDEDE